MTPRASLLQYAALWVVYVCLLAAVPILVPPDVQLPNAAARTGYNIEIAYLAVASWSILGAAFVALSARLREPAAVGPPPAHTQGGLLGSRLLECALVGAAIAFVYWPSFLARYGPYIEDNYFLNVLFRMECGQLPYRDFEFLYGPLLIYPARYWMELFGFSMTSYYSFLALLEGLAFATTLYLFQLHIPDRRTRYAAYILIVPVIFDSILGLNYIAWRVLPVVGALVVSAASKPSLKRHLIAGSLAGVQLALTVDYGVIAVIAISLVTLPDVFTDSIRRVAIRLTGFLTCSVVTASVIVVFLTGPSAVDYGEALAYTLRYAQESGIGSFRFYWTANSLCLFALLSVAVASVARRLAQFRHRMPTYDERLLLGSCLFTVGALKVAIQRADVWHLTMAFVPLVMTLLWCSQPHFFDRVTRRAIWIVILLAAITRGIGLLPTGSLFLDGWARGALDEIRGVETSAPAASGFRQYSVLSERSEADKDIVSVASYLADAERRERPVVFYNALWSLGIDTGVCPSGYSFYQLMYTDALHPMTGILDQRPDSLVVMDDHSFRELFENEIPSEEPGDLSVTKRVAGWLSSIHYEQREVEGPIRRDMWRENLGVYLVDHYHRVYQAGRYVVLERTVGPDAVFR